MQAEGKYWESDSERALEREGEGESELDGDGDREVDSDLEGGLEMDGFSGGTAAGGEEHGPL